jgi:DNA polymerase-3 subunit epsilon
MSSTNLPAGQAPFVALLDTETTGFKPTAGDRILEIAVVRLDPSGAEVSRWSTLLDPGPDKDLGAIDIHQITREHVTGAPTFRDIAGDFIAQVRGAVITAHNAPFDIRFVKAEFERAGLTWPDPPVADTLGAARFLLPGLPSYKLGALVEHLGLEFDGEAHTALADAAVTAGLYRELLALTRSVSWPDPDRVLWPEVPVSGRTRTR